MSFEERLSQLFQSSFLEAVTPAIAFRQSGSARIDIVRQMKALAKLYRGHTGNLVCQMIGASQLDPAMRKATCARYGGHQRLDGRQRMRCVAKGSGRLTEGTKETASHSLSIAESRLASNFLDWQPTLLEHEPGGLEAQVFNCLCR